MGARPDGLLAVVEIGGDATLLIVGAVFVATFIAVAAVGYLLLRKARTDGTTPTWHFQLQTRLPVSKPAFDQISRATEAALATPTTSPATRAQFDQLDRARNVFVSVYRVVMILVGLAGATGGALLIRSHTPGNMQGLPGGIILLLSLGALLNGLIPPRSIRPISPLEPAVLDEAKKKIRIGVSHSAPLQITLSATDLQRAAESLRLGVPVAEVARGLYPSYDTLDDMERHALESLIRQAAGS
jgi:hypothetical protein